ncbi:hypothetical protein S40288_05993 [Stachybotrys chartarum IBT 40288]|nr:hypothetical protein S40288_05993 [Stachybotrys chartarum IBT 40288]
MDAFALRPDQPTLVLEAYLATAGNTTAEGSAIETDPAATADDAITIRRTDGKITYEEAVAQDLMFCCNKVHSTPKALRDHLRFKKKHGQQHKVEEHIVQECSCGKKVRGAAKLKKHMFGELHSRRLAEAEQQHLHSKFEADKEQAVSNALEAEQQRPHAKFEADKEQAVSNALEAQQQHLHAKFEADTQQAGSSALEAQQQHLHAKFEADTQQAGSSALEAQQQHLHAKFEADTQQAVEAREAELHASHEIILRKKAKELQATFKTDLQDIEEKLGREFNTTLITMEMKADFKAREQEQAVSRATLAIKEEELRSEFDATQRKLQSECTTWAAKEKRLRSKLQAVEEKLSAMHTEVRTEAHTETRKATRQTELIKQAENRGIMQGRMMERKAERKRLEYDKQSWEDLRKEYDAQRDSNMAYLKRALDQSVEFERQEYESGIQRVEKLHAKRRKQVEDALDKIQARSEGLGSLNG